MNNKTNLGQNIAIALTLALSSLGIGKSSDV